MKSKMAQSQETFAQHKEEHLAELGDNNKDGKMDNKIAEKEFPILMKKLSEK